MRISDWSSDVCSSDLAPSPAADEQIGFAADALEYDNNSQIVTARGNVELVREGNRLRADEVVWNRATGEVRANGNISVTNPQGDIAYGDSIEITDTMKDGICEHLMLVRENGGRLAGRRGPRAHEHNPLDNAG